MVLIFSLRCVSGSSVKERSKMSINSFRGIAELPSYNENKVRIPYGVKWKNQMFVLRLYRVLQRKWSGRIRWQENGSKGQKINELMDCEL